jgi:uncharacterized protein (TIGR01777 family)
MNTFLSALRGAGEAAAAPRTGRKSRGDQPLPPIHFGAGANRVLVTGATGFIGRLLVRALIADGQNVTVLTRDPAAAARMFADAVHCIAGMDALPATQQIDVVINLAGARILGARWTAARKSLLRKSRTDLTRGVVDWIARAERKPRLFLSASAIGYYGIQQAGDDAVLTEHSPPQSIFMSQLCQDWEAAAQGACAHGVRVVRMRLGLVLGHGGALPMMALPIRLGLGGSLGGGRQWLSWIHVHDLLRGIAHVWQIAERADPAWRDAGVYNFTAPEAVAQREFSGCAAEVLHRFCILPTPGWPVRLLLGEQADLLLEGQRVAPAALQAQGFAFSYPTLRTALENLL